MGYQMTRTMFNTYLKTRNKTEEKKNPYIFMMDVINQEFGIKGKVTHITILEDE